MIDNFMGDGKDYTLRDGQVSPNKLWKCVYASYGTVGTRNVSEPLNNHQGKVFYLKPKPPVDVNDTAACLVLTEQTFKDFDMTFYMRTLAHNRTPKPNDWETAWIFFRYTDKTPQGKVDKHHHYYAYIGTDGIMEIGKKDYELYSGGLITPDGKKHPGDQEQQQFLFYTKPKAITFVLKKWFKIRIIAKGRNIKVYVDNVLKADITDDGTIGYDSANNRKDITYPASETMLSGKVGLYCEDSAVEFDNIEIKNN